MHLHDPGQEGVLPPGTPAGGGSPLLLCRSRGRGLLDPPWDGLRRPLVPKRVRPGCFFPMPLNSGHSHTPTYPDYNNSWTTQSNLLQGQKPPLPKRSTSQSSLGGIRGKPFMGEGGRYRGGACVDRSFLPHRRGRAVPLWKSPPSSRPPSPSPSPKSVRAKATLPQARHEQR